MTRADYIAKSLIRGLSDAALVKQWELTSESESVQVSIVRGWLMDELEARYPEMFNQWLDESCDDYELRKYILG